jgi:hypothetical protein
MKNPAELPHVSCIVPRIAPRDGHDRETLIPLPILTSVLMLFDLENACVRENMDSVSLRYDDLLTVLFMSDTSVVCVSCLSSLVLRVHPLLSLLVLHLYSPYFKTISSPHNERSLDGSPDLGVLHLQQPTRASRLKPTVYGHQRLAPTG